MPTAKDKALLGVGGAVGLSLAAWRAFFPWIGYDLSVMRIGRKYGKLVMDDLANERYLIEDGLFCIRIAAVSPSFNPS
jgi:hypothetical protein